MLFPKGIRSQPHVEIISGPVHTVQKVIYHPGVVCVAREDINISGVSCDLRNVNVSGVSCDLGNVYVSGVSCDLSNVNVSGVSCDPGNVNVSGVSIGPHPGFL